MNDPIKSKYILRKITTFAYISGIPYLWYEELGWPKQLTNFHDKITNILTVLLCIFMSLEILALFTQKNMNNQQSSDALKYAISQPIFFMNFFSFVYYKEEVRILFYNLTNSMSTYHRDEEVERKLVKKIKFYVSAFISVAIAASMSAGLDGLWRVLEKDDTFTTVITAWPDVDDRSLAAGIGRIIAFIMWCIHTVRFVGGVTIVVALTVCVCHQYKYLQSYFYSLDKIFEINCSQSVKEEEYEKGLLIGVKLHNNIIRYTQDLCNVCNIAYGGQIVVNVTVLVILMVQMQNGNRQFMLVLTCAIMVSALLVLNGFYMWNLGDITVEASEVCTAMYMSGWENCTRRSSVRVRKILMVAMTQAQKEVTIKTLMILQVSYASYVSIVKFSYSVFSLIY
uniref:Odorant receptor n=1 Tax=Histia rhodope TaxID=1453155 RepID=A0A7G4KBU5_9NEOP|nr:odorant receptor [Histia rhodope]